MKKSKVERANMVYRRVSDLDLTEEELHAALIIFSGVLRAEYSNTLIELCKWKFPRLGNNVLEKAEGSSIELAHKVKKARALREILNDLEAAQLKLRKRTE